METMPDIGTIEKLSVRERLDLIDRIWDTMPQESPVEEVPAWHIDLLEERLKAVDESTPPGRPWREVVDEIKARLVEARL